MNPAHRSQPPPPQTPSRVGGIRSLAGDPTIVPAVVAFAVLGAFAVKNGGFSTTTWYPGALVFLVLAGFAGIAAVYGHLAIPRLVAAAIVALAGYTAWCYASIAWSEVKGDAWDGANRTLLYLLVLTFFALLPWQPRTVTFLVAAFSTAVAGVGFAELARAAGAENLDAYFQFGRFASPLTYQNGNAALFMMAFWPALYVCSRRGAPLLARGLLAASAAVLVQLTLLTQSRALVLVAPATFALYLLVVPGRLRSVIHVLIPALAVALTYEPLLRVFTALRHPVGDPASAIEHARNVVAVTGLAAACCGLGLALVDRHVTVRRSVQRVVGWLAAAAALAIACAAIVVWAPRHPIARLDDAWASFKTPRTTPPEGTTYFSAGVSGTRYDLWRVALDEVKRSPLVGVGVDNFAVDYVRERRSIDEPLYPHSVVLRVLSQTGIVGALLAMAFASLALAAGWRLRRVPTEVRGIAAVLAVVAAYWFLHGTIDWFWEIPALGGLAFAWVGIILRVVASADRPIPAPPRAVALTAGGILTAASLLSLGAPWLAAQETATASSTWSKHPADAFGRLERARTLNPLSAQPDLVAGAIASRLGDLPRMRSFFGRAVEREPSNWYGHLELSMAAALQDDLDVARKHLAKANELNPGEPTIDVVAGDLAAGRKPSPTEIDRLLLARIGITVAQNGRGTRSIPPRR